MKHVHNIAIRNVDLLRLFRDWLPLAKNTPGTKVSALSGAILLACANFEGMDPRAVKFGATVVDDEGAPGRPRGITGARRGTGRRTRVDAWSQCGVLHCVWQHLTMCQDLIQANNKSHKRPSKALVLRAVSAKPLRGVRNWITAPPMWAVTTAGLENHRSSVLSHAMDLCVAGEDEITISPFLHASMLGAHDER